MGFQPVGPTPAALTRRERGNERLRANASWQPEPARRWAMAHVTTHRAQERLHTPKPLLRLFRAGLLGIGIDIGKPVISRLLREPCR